MKLTIGKITATVYVRTVSEANSHTHWRARQKRAKEQRALSALALDGIRWALRQTLPAVVTLTRVAPGKLDTDNLAGSMKHVRDGVADAFGVDDGDDRYDWRYAQRKGGKGEYAVEITIAAAKT